MTTTPTIHRKLTIQQLNTLQLLSTFRFGTSDLLAAVQPKPIVRRVMNKRLALLHSLNLIDKRLPQKLGFDNQYALYCLTATGIKVLRVQGVGNTQALRNLRKDAQASDMFAHHCLGIFTVHNELYVQYKDRLQFLTRSFLYGKETFPNPLPDGFITISEDGDRRDKQLLLEYIDDTKPQKVWQQRILQLIDYIEGGEWEETETDPALLFVCASPWLEKRVNQWIRKADADNLVECTQIYVATIENVAVVITKAEHEKSPEARDSSRALVWEGY